MRSKFNFDEVLKKMDQVKKDLPLKLANTTKNHFLKDNFDKQQFNGQKWEEPQRKKKKGGSSRNNSATLVQSSRLRRALINSLKKATWEQVQFLINDVPYAGIHNYGGIIKQQGRTHILHFNKAGRFSKKKKAKYAQKAKSGPRTINMPQRQFIGDDKQLRKKQLDLIIKDTKGIWQA